MAWRGLVKVGLTLGVAWVLACGDDDAVVDGGGTATPDAAAADSGASDAAADAATDAPGHDAAAGDAGAADAGGEDAGMDAGSEQDGGDTTQCTLVTDFEGLEDGSDWPSPWSVAGGVAIADVVGGRGRLVPTTSGYSLARMVAPLGCRDAEATLRFELTDGSTQGVGYYVRQNGGHLRVTTPRGEGYAGFAEAFRNPAGIGVWRENDGDEEQLGSTTPLAVVPDVVFRMRVRVEQISDTQSRVQARIWREEEAEPSLWQAEATDDLPSLQGVSGGVAIDAWSSLQSGDAHAIFVDDIDVRPLR